MKKTFLLIIAILFIAAAYAAGQNSPARVDAPSPPATTSVPLEPAFYLARFEGADEKVLKEILPFLSEQLLNVPVIIIDKPIPVPEDSWSEVRKKYYAGKMIEHLAQFSPENSLAMIALTDRDIFAGRFPYVHGLSNPKLGTAVASTFRLQGTDTQERFRLRVLKEFLHELGHLMGMDHCVNPKLCVMGFSSDLMGLDARYRTYCPFHKNQLREYLINKGIDLSKYALPADSGKKEEDASKDGAAAGD